MPTQPARRHTVSSRSTDRLSDRNAGFDLVRGVSIILVIIHHTAIRIPLPRTALARFLPHPLLMDLSWDGYEAVFVFFVVSGFLITKNAMERWGVLRDIRLGSFYIRRIARIQPCLLILVAMLVIFDLLSVPNYTIDRGDQSLPWATLSALAFHLNWYEGHTGYLPGGWDVLWSLSIEEVFYLGFPIICLVIGRTRMLPILVFGLIALSLPLTFDMLAHAAEIWREKAYLPGMAAIATGVCAALAVCRASRPPGTLLPAAIGWLGLFLLGSLFWWEPAVYRLLGNGSMLMLTVGTASLMIAFEWGWGRTHAARGTAWLRSFGAMSYEIYLTHMFVVFSLVHLFRKSGGDLATGWIWFVPVLGSSWVLGWLVDRTLSTPANLWLRHKFDVQTKQPLPTSATV